MRRGDAAADLRRANAELQKRLDECRAALDEALAREAASAEVLRVINSSPGDLAPVFNAMLEKAMRLCGAHSAYLVLTTANDSKLPPSTAHPRAIRRSSASATRRAHGPGTTHVATIVAGERGSSMSPTSRMKTTYRPESAVAARWSIWAGRAALLQFRLLKDDAVLGCYRAIGQEVRPFSDKQIALLRKLRGAGGHRDRERAAAWENYASEPTTSRESLEYQTATSNVLQVISRSTFDLQPVLDTLVETAARLCDA